MKPSPESDECLGALSKRISWLPSEWVFKSIVIAGLVANLYLQSHYVTVDRYEKDAAAHATRDTKVDATLTSLDKSLAILTEQQKAQVAQDVLLADHEARIRALEARVR